MTTKVKTIPVKRTRKTFEEIRSPKLPPLYVGDRKYSLVDEMLEIEIPKLRRTKKDYTLHFLLGGLALFILAAIFGVFGNGDMYVR
jgi:hypothetical protein